MLGALMLLDGTAGANCARAALARAASAGLWVGYPQVESLR